MTEPPAQGRPARQLLNSAALPCGAEVDLLLEQAAGGRGSDLDEHQLGCVHCQAALTEFTALWTPVTESAAQLVSAPPELAAAVMSRIRGLVRDVWYTLETTNLGAIRIAARIVAALARDSARTVPGVRVVLGRSSDSRLAAVAERASFRHRHPHGAVGVLGRTAVVDLAVAVAYGEQVHLVARAIQREVLTALRNQLGLKTVSVNVTIDDIFTDEDL